MFFVSFGPRLFYFDLNLEDLNESVSPEDLDYNLIQEVKDILLPFSDMGMKVSCDYIDDGNGNLNNSEGSHVTVNTIDIQNNNWEFTDILFTAYSGSFQLGVNLNDIQNELVDPNCPKFVDVTDDFCLQTECFEFCLNADALFLAKGVFSADIYVPYKTNAQINLSGGHKITKASAYSFSAISNNTLIGNAAASGNNLLPNVAFTGSGSQKLLVTSNTYCSYLGEFPTYGYGDLTVELIGAGSATFVEVWIQRSC